MPSDLWPYGYYILLRWVVAGTGLFAAYITYNLKKAVWSIVLILIALLFNPLIPVHLEKEGWVVIDFVVALFYLVAVFVIRFPKDKEIEQPKS